MTLEGIKNLTRRLEDQRRMRHQLRCALLQLNHESAKALVTADWTETIPIYDPKVKAAIKLAITCEIDRLDKWILRTESRMRRWK